MRIVRVTLKTEGRQSPKLKEARIHALTERGGFDAVADRVGEMLSAAGELPDHATAKMQLLQNAALCLVHMNKPARTGDASRWRIGQDLVRLTDGTWRLAWHQEKTGRGTGAGELWPEVCMILDILVLGGRPHRFIHLRYRELLGANWLTQTWEDPGRKFVSDRIRASVGVPSHDLRTLAADYMRRHDPAVAANVIATHLGHASEKAGEDYRALCEGEAAAREWAEMREVIGQRMAKGNCMDMLAAITSAVV